MRMTGRLLGWMHRSGVFLGPDLIIVCNELSISLSSSAPFSRGGVPLGPTIDKLFRTKMTADLVRKTHQSSPTPCLDETHRFLDCFQKLFLDERKSTSCAN
ncbi:hypothetical protein CDAR_534671 [Caerostris darwini]|uniref:Uncharacterized protein n=1 Tax=Caerostris darwini TaxID=1538125 RepID=A0AAV4NNY2_9ARAC|nr:hypothetical protein CDAR_534671 [Caerostris darwini]